MCRYLASNDLVYDRMKQFVQQFDFGKKNFNGFRQILKNAANMYVVTKTEKIQKIITFLVSVSLFPKIALSEIRTWVSTG